MSSKIGGIIFFCMLTLLADINPASAEPTYKFEGFGTFGVSHSSQKLGDYTLDSTIPKGAGISQDWAMGNDSRIGAQMTGDLTNKVSTVLQVISEYRAEGNYKPVVEWANIKYIFSPNTHIRAGRIALPTFLNSDNRKVGYSYPWIHPPLELYRQLAITNSDGVDIMYRSDYWSGLNTLKLLYGSNTIDRSTSTSTSKNIWGIFDTFELGKTTTHVGYQERESRSRNNLSGITGDWIPNSDLSIGASYDSGAWFASTEWIQRKSTTKISAMYLSAGMRWSELTPYLTYSQNSPGSVLPGNAQLSANSIRVASRSQSAVSLGLRWDFKKNADLKLQYDQVQLSDRSNGFLANVPNNVTLYGSKFHVISFMADFVF